VTAPSPQLEHALNPLVRLLRWLRDRVHGLYRALGLFLVIALALGLGAVWVFAELAEHVVSGGTQRFDDAVLGWINQHASPALDRWALGVTAVGNGATVAVITLVLIAFLWVLEQRGAVLLIVMAVVGADLLQSVLKLAFQRPRPEEFVIQTPFARPVSTSFPSGHATGAIALYLVLGYLLTRLGGKGLAHWVINGFFLLLILGIGLSRMYLGVHYPSDVIAGYLIGFVWVSLCIFGIESVRIIRKRSRQPDMITDPAPPVVAKSST
jgi:undecaprenyl-diphosphatase